jgi:hypothetical protein
MNRREGTVRLWPRGGTVGFVIGVMMSVLLLPAAPGLAVDCGNGGHNVERFQSDDMHRGASAGDVMVWDHNDPDHAPDGSNAVACDRVDTLLVFNAADKQMEVGWHIIPDNSSVCAIDTSNAQQPFFVIIKTNGFNQTCQVSNGPIRITAPASHAFKENNPNHDGNWEFFLDGSQRGTATTAWTIGWVTANAEAHDLQSDSARSDFDQLKYITSTGPSDWDAQALWADCSTKYDSTQVSQVHVRVVQGTGTYVC